MPIQEIAKNAVSTIQNADPKVLRQTGDICFLAGFASIAGSILAWAMKKGDDTDAHAERFGIFVGLWAPTFFILSNRFERYAERAEEKKLVP
jgi:hypothetical protein